MIWIKSKDQRPPPGAMIVKRWKSGAVWAGRSSGSDKESSFDEWCSLEDTPTPLNPSELANACL